MKKKPLSNTASEKQLNFSRMLQGIISSPGILAFAKRDIFEKCSSQSELREHSFDQSATTLTRYFSRAFLRLQGAALSCIFSAIMTANTAN